jgi:hypothetical protein
MGYNIEVSFSLIKNSSVTELQENIKNLATNCGCSYFYEDYEYETHVRYQRKHYIITLNFNNTNIYNLISFLRNIKKSKGLYIEVIYDDDSNKIIYASNYYITQKMEKSCSKIFKDERKKRTYSEEDFQIIEIMKKSK